MLTSAASVDPTELSPLDRNARPPKGHNDPIRLNGKDDPATRRMIEEHIARKGVTVCRPGRAQGITRMANLDIDA